MDAVTGKALLLNIAGHFFKYIILMSWAPEVSTPFPCSEMAHHPHPQHLEVTAQGQRQNSITAEYKPSEGQSLYSIHHPAAQIKEATNSIVMLSE